MGILNNLWFPTILTVVHLKNCEIHSKLCATARKMKTQTNICVRNGITFLIKLPLKNQIHM